jgi:sortase A
VTSGPPDEARPPGDDGRVTLIGARRTSVADRQRELRRLSEALELAEARRHTAERTLADVASMAAADTADLRVRLAELQARLDGAPPAAVAQAPTGGRTRLRALRRLLLLAGLVIGFALLADGILTIVWQEPITALQQSRDQAALRTDLSGLQHMLAAAPKAPGESTAARMRRQALTLLRAKRPDGSALGSVDIPRSGL